MHLHRYAECLQLADDVGTLRIADVGDVLLEGQPEHGHGFGAHADFSSRRTHSRAMRAPIVSLMRRPARITSG